MSSASLPVFVMLGSMKTFRSPASETAENADVWDIEPVPSDWTDSLLERLDALECACLSSGCVCEETAYIRSRTAPAVERDKFIKLARRTGMSNEGACEYYKNYLVDIRTRQSSVESQELLDQICDATRALRESLSEEEAAIVLTRLKTASQKRYELLQRIYEPLQQ